MDEIILIGAFIMSAGTIWLTNWLALMPWRHNQDKHWSEQARLAYPVMMAARSNLWTIPGVLILIVLLTWPNSSPLWLFTGMVAVLGGFAGIFPLYHEIFPRISFHDLLRQAGISLLLGLLAWFVVLGAAVMMPDEFNLEALAIGCGVVVIWLIWVRGGLVWLGRILGLLQPAPERLQNIAADTASRMSVPFGEVWLMRSPFAQAWAMPRARKLLFTERMLEIAPDDEVAAICAHELAHLAESKADRYARSIQMLAFLPWIYFNPLTHSFGPAFGFITFCVLILATIVFSCIFQRISRKLELRADRIAKANEGDFGTYARALARGYADNLVPAVMAKSRGTHPHLYDRLLAAGVTPDFPRPAAAASMAWHGRVIAGLVGLLLSIFAMRLLYG